ncbi:hypothetical protein BZJ19_13845 [Salinivibrio proteolyticus]|uniref:DUF6151 family protein n=1 Tax=Salinivibrio proteolyticus TaxID=334715 RepID=UPI000988E3A7|nr:DUF6151 family protein [Salinivibrio proteolyticus]OOF22990.1 hypothetical protein BZJ19_13845 [Salinivibrio proteolyticus]
MTRLNIQCACGQVTGEIIDARRSQRCVCYCKDCQAFAEKLGYHTELKPGGGTEILQITPAQLRVYRGRDKLSCARLSEKGLYRWYASCCHTPIANTISAAIPFIGIISSCYHIEGDNEEEIGPVRWYVQGQDARSPIPEKNVHPRFPLSLMIRTALRIGWARLLGQHRPNAFFDRQGQPRGVVYYPQDAMIAKPDKQPHPE